MFVYNAMFRKNPDQYEHIPELDIEKQPILSTSQQHSKHQPPTQYQQSYSSQSYQKQSPNQQTTIADDSEEEMGRETTCWEDFDRAMTLTRWERIIGFLILFVLGWGLSLTTLSSYKTILYTPLKFCLWYTIGNILSLSSNFFLYGPVRQLKSMFNPPHRFPSLLYVTAIIATLYCAISDGIDIKITIAAVIIQFIASIIFTLSYIINGVFGKAICWLVKYTQTQFDNDYDTV